MSRRLWVLLLLALLQAPAIAARPATIPVYIEDSHAGSFYWMIQNLSLVHPVDLLLIDAHSDISEVADSDDVRRRVLEAASGGTLGTLVGKWRTAGTIQCFNWIEPLMPRPIANVYWVPAESLTPAQRSADLRHVREQINAHEMAVPRQVGDLSGRVRVLGFRDLSRRRFAHPIVVSIDLDYFVHQEPAQVRRVVRQVLGLENLQAVTFAISRPYLPSDEAAARLLHDALREVCLLVNADIQYEPFVHCGPDRSLRAALCYRQGVEVPLFDVSRAPAFLRGLLLQQADRIRVRVDAEQWRSLLARWQVDVPMIRQEGECIQSDRPGDWRALVAESDCYNLVGGSQGYAERARGVLRCKDVAVGVSGAVLRKHQLRRFFDAATGWGTVRLYCSSHGLCSNLLCVSQTQGEGYPGHLTEIFNLPYIYGSALLRVAGQWSADARYGADCCSFIIYGKRRQGWDIPYVNPGQLVDYLCPIDEFVAFRDGVAYGKHGRIQVNRGWLSEGLLLHFGKHVAAFVELSDGGGFLRPTDRVAHQLETSPRVTTFAALAKRYPHIRIMKFSDNSTDGKIARKWRR